MVIGFDASRAFVHKRTGTENYSFELLKHLLEIDQRNTYRVYLRNMEPHFDPLLAGDNVVPVPIKQKRLWTQAGLAKEVLFNTPDVLFIPAHTLPVIHKKGLRTVVTVHDLGAEYLPHYHKFPHKLYLNRSTEYAVKKASRLIAVSEATKHDLIKRLKADPRKISVVYEGFNRSNFYPQPQNEIDRVAQVYGLKKPYFLFVSTIQPRKNLVRLIEAFARFKTTYISHDYDQMIHGSQLVLAGKKGWLSDDIYAAPKRNGIENEVKFIDFVPANDLPPIISGATAFCYPSLFEGFGLPILEAMACGTPVITSNISSMPEVGGDAVYYVNPHDVQAIATAFYRLLTENRLQTDLITLGMSQIEKFSWQKAANETLEVLEAVGKPDED